MSYKFTMYSDVYGEETFDGYDSIDDAMDGIARIMASARELNDGIERYFGTIEKDEDDQEEGDDDAQS